MPDPIVIDLVCEDSGHERFLVPLVRRLATQLDFMPQIRVLSARGGAPSVKTTVQIWANQVSRGKRVTPGMLVVGHDANCQGYKVRTADILGWAADHKDLVVPACPDAHVERWYLADQEAFLSVVGGRGRMQIPEKCERGLYKRLLQKAVVDAGQLAIEGGLEFGQEIAEAIDPVRLERLDPSFKAFHRSLRARLNQLRPGAGTLA